MAEIPIETPPRVRHDIQAMTVSLGVIAIGVVGFVCYVLAPILKPFFMAVFLYFLMTPGAEWISRFGVPRWAAYTAMTVVLFGLCVVTGYFVYDNLSDLTENIPLYQDRIGSWIDAIARRTGLADDTGHFDWRRYAPGHEVRRTVTDFLGTVFGTLVDFLGLLIAVVFYLIFIVAETARLPGRVTRAFSETGAVRVGLMVQTINLGIQKYLVVKTIVSLGVGVIAGGVLFAFDVDYWFLWAVLTFVLNYIPYVGALIASVFPILMAFIQFPSPVYGLVIAGLLIADHTFWGSYLEPKILGHQLNISPTVLLLLLALWGWLWGIAGAFLSVPLGVATMILLENFPRTRPLSILFAEE